MKNNSKLLGLVLVLTLSLGACAGGPATVDTQTPTASEAPMTPASQPDEEESNSPFTEADYEPFLQAAQQGDAGAMTKLAYMYVYGYGVEQNYAQALEWYEKGAELGNAVAVRNMGKMYLFGYGVERNYIKAVRSYLKAAMLEKSSELGIMNFP